MKRTDGGQASTWQTSVTELVNIFRDALAAVAPVLERAHIKSNEGDAYDDWDEIAQALFDSIVSRSLAWSGEVGGHLDLGRYATIHTSYRNEPYIVVSGNGTTPDGTFVFLDVTSERGKFDAVRVLRLDSAANPMVEEVALPLEGLSFGLHLPTSPRVIEDLTVHL